MRCATPEGQRGVYTWYRVNCRLIVEEGKPDRVVGAIYNIHEMLSLIHILVARIRFFVLAGTSSA